MMEQKQLRLEISRDMLDNANSDPNFLNTVMRRGFMGTTQKQRCSPHNGNIQHPLGQKKHDLQKVGAQPQQLFLESKTGQ
jgi:hypothetical protein